NLLGKGRPKSPNHENKGDDVSKTGGGGGGGDGTAVSGSTGGGNNAPPRSPTAIISASRSGSPECISVAAGRDRGNRSAEGRPLDSVSAVSAGGTAESVRSVGSFRTAAASAQNGLATCIRGEIAGTGSPDRGHCIQPAAVGSPSTPASSQGPAFVGGASGSVAAGCAGTLARQLTTPALWNPADMTRTLLPSQKRQPEWWEQEGSPLLPVALVSTVAMPPPLLPLQPQPRLPAVSAPSAAATATASLAGSAASSVEAADAAGAASPSSALGARTST
ncbi:unnamed protein product, partial [Phaeothamnion confervicola]